MDEKIVEQIIDELFSSFEKSETQSAALLLFLKDQKIATEEKLAPYFEQAGRISEVRWRAARVRMNALIGSAIKSAEPQPEKKKRSSEKEKPEPEKKASTEDKDNQVDKDKQAGSERIVQGEGKQPTAESPKADDKHVAKSEPEAGTSEANPRQPKPEQGSEQKSEDSTNPKKDASPNPATVERSQNTQGKPKEEETITKAKPAK